MPLRKHTLLLLRSHYSEVVSCSVCYSPAARHRCLGTIPAAITVQGSSLGVSEGKAVSIVGGEIQVVGGLPAAPSGRVQESAWQARAGTREGLETECARWTGHKRPTVRRKR
jgi:hypothetical protein